MIKVHEVPGIGKMVTWEDYLLVVRKLNDAQGRLYFLEKVVEETEASFNDESFDEKLHGIHDAVSLGDD